MRENATPTAWLTVYCASRLGKHEAYAEATRRLATLMLERNIGLVYGGSRIGLMGLIADTLIEGGGSVHGIMPTHLLNAEVNHPGLTTFEEVADMTVRKRRMLALGDACLALPGGLGTLEELFEVWSWRQLDLHRKPIGLLNTAGYYDGLIGFMQHTVDVGLTRSEAAAHCLNAVEPEQLLPQLLPQCF